MSGTSKLTVVGAGAVGSSVAYAALIRESARDIALYDIAPEKTEAEVLDLAHGSFFAGSSQITGGSDIAVAADSDIVVITAGAKQRPGQTRLELAATNARIMGTLMPQLIDVAPDAVYVIVTNPCDVLTLLADESSGLPAGRVFASGTALDSSRLRWEIARRAGVSTSSVHAQIVGEHGDSEIPVWSTATIGTVPILEWRGEDGTGFDRAELERIAVDVRDAAYTVIRGKGATNYAIGLSSARIVEAVLRDEHAILPVAPVLRGERGIDGVALSVPCVLGRHGARPIAGTGRSVDGDLTHGAPVLDVDLLGNDLRSCGEILRELLLHGAEVLGVHMGLRALVGERLDQHVGGRVLDAAGPLEMRKLELIHAAKDVEDLRIPPGNRLERLVGDRRGQHSIRVNAQWRICFVWREGGAEDVELVDYH